MLEFQMIFDCKKAPEYYQLVINTWSNLWRHLTPL